MAVLLDKLSQRGINKFKGVQPSQAVQPQQAIQQPSPLPSITQDISRPPTPDRISQLPQRGPIGSLPQNQGIKQRIVADLPAKVQIEGIQGILNGQDTTSPVVNNFVKGMAAQGKNPEEIRQAFINQQKTTKNPLVIQ